MLPTRKKEREKKLTSELKTQETKNEDMKKIFHKMEKKIKLG